MKSVKEEIATNLLFYRKKSKLTQKELADRIGVKNNTISQWENGTNSIDVEVLFNICEVLEVSVSDMYGSFSNTTELSLSASEMDIVSKFRKLDERGKLSITRALEQEYSYTETQQPHVPDVEQIAKEAQAVKKAMDATVPLKK